MFKKPNSLKYVPENHNLQLLLLQIFLHILSLLPVKLFSWINQYNLEVMCLKFISTGIIVTGILNKF